MNHPNLSDEIAKSEEIVIAHWPGKDTPACPKHLAQMRGVAEAMGFPLSYSPAPPDSVCANCENAEKKGRA